MGMNGQTGATGRKTMKMADIARIAGVSPSTVSRALAGNAKIPEPTREAIEAIAEEHGYVINRSARNLRQSTTNTIGIAVPLGHETEQLVTDPFFLRLFGHIADAISQRRYDTLLVREPAPDPLWLQRLIRSQRADGYIIVGQSNLHDVLNAAAPSFLPMVVGGGEIANQRYCSVGSNDLEGGRLATEHLIGIGRRGIMFVGPAELPQVDLRLAGHHETLAKHGIARDENLYVSAHFNGPEAYEEVARVLASGTAVDAVFAASDGIALSVIRAVEDAGLRCPEDVAVVGFDDTALATQSRPALTTIRQNIPAMGRTMVDLLFQRMSGRDTKSVFLPVELVIRESAPLSVVANGTSRAPSAALSA